MGGYEDEGVKKIFSEYDVNEIVRLYDGSGNPIGKAYSKKEFLAMVEGLFEVTDRFLHFFPAQALPFSVSRKLHSWLDRNFGFMIYLNLRKPEPEN